MKTRYWFAARRPKDGVLCYVVSATSLRKAKRSFGLIGKRYELAQLKWSALTKLLECQPPAGSNGISKARGDLVLKVKDCYIAIRVAD